MMFQGDWSMMNAGQGMDLQMATSATDMLDGVNASLAAQGVPSRNRGNYRCSKVCLEVDACSLYSAERPRKDTFVPISL